MRAAAEESGAPLPITHFKLEDPARPPAPARAGSHRPRRSDISRLISADTRTSAERAPKRDKAERVAGHNLGVRSAPCGVCATETFRVEFLLGLCLGGGTV
ncbi:hypothetical protein AcV5_008471 [Taiwanofungus camphoratus]|nr:hypothetical protein AcV5_008471 [Antrodia cinnamomea]